MTGVFTRKGINANRRLTDPRRNYDDELQDIASSTADPFLLRAVVVDVLFDPEKQLSEIQEKFSESNLKNPSDLQLAPKNSILARIISLAEDRRDNSPYVVYPFFSHIHQPVKPGEHVWVLFENPAAEVSLGYWLSRIVDTRDIDDPNYTHADRKFAPGRNPSTIDRLREAGKFSVSAQDEQDTKSGPGFPNGTDLSDSLTLAGLGDYEEIFSKSSANRIISYEPVPRYVKRPSDWVAEGSNNSLFVLGEDRTGSASRGLKVEGKPEADKPKSSGMFDLVVGRGLGEQGRIPNADETPVATQPSVVVNTRGFQETNKDLSKNAKPNPNEGNPDFEYDATRIYGAMDTSVDTNFGKPLPKLNEGIEPTQYITGPALVTKSNNIRIIARQNGAVRIIKEGEEDSSRAVVLIEADGTIMIDGPKIIIGSGIEQDHGAGNQVFLGRDATESAVLGDTLKQLLNDYSADIKSSLANFTSALNGANVGNLGGPIPGITAAVPILDNQINAATQKFQTNLKTALSKVCKTK